MDDGEQKYGKEVSWSHEKMVKASLAATTPERKWSRRHIIGWLDWASVDKRRHAILALDDATHLQRHEQEHSNAVPGGERTGTERLLRCI
jgi:hypothetical protein